MHMKPTITSYKAQYIKEQTSAQCIAPWSHHIYIETHWIGLYCGLNLMKKLFIMKPSIKAQYKGLNKASVPT